MKYLDLLNLTADETAKSNNEMIAEEASLNLQSAIFAAKKEIVSKKNYIETLKKSNQLNFGAITNGVNDLQLAERLHGQLVELQKELFPNE